MIRQLGAVLIGFVAFIALSLALALELVGLIEPMDERGAYERRDYERRPR